MKLFKALLHVILWEVTFSAAEYKYEIIRQTPGDTFKLPSLLCTSTWETKCQTMGGTNTVNYCICECTEVNKNVFGYFGNSWKCASNRDVRRNYSECSAYEVFNDGHSDTPLMIANPVTNQKHKTPLGYFAKYCKLESQISYFNCYGEWIQLNQSSNHGFLLEEDDGVLYYWGKNSFDVYQPKIYGHLVKIHMSCSKDKEGHKQGGHCALFKINGTQNCPVVLPTTLVSSPIPTSTNTAQLSQTISLVSSTLLSKSPNDQTPATFSYESTTTHLIIESSLSVHVTQSEVEPTKPTTAKSTANLPVIGVSTGGIAAFAIVLVTLIIIVRRKRYSQTKPAAAADNAADGKLSMQSQEQLDTDSSHAYSNSNPTCIQNQNDEVAGDCATNPDVKEVHVTSQDTHDVRFPSMSFSVNIQLNKPESIPSSPVSITLNDLRCYENAQSPQDEPTYNVLERPKTKCKTSQVYEIPEIFEDLGQSASTSLQYPLKDLRCYENAQSPQDEPTYDVIERPETKWKTTEVYEIPKDFKVQSDTTPLQYPRRSIYNRLDRPSNRKPDQSEETQNESFYNVLHHAETNMATRQRYISGSPEEPKSDGNPVYEVIKSISDDQLI